MSTTTPDLEKGIETRADQAGAFGVDAGGYIHKYHQPTNLLVVEDPDGDVAYARTLTPDQITKPTDGGWIQWVRDNRGWVDQWFDEDVGLFEATARLEDATNGVPENTEVLE